MSQKKKPSSCLGLFLKGFIVSNLVLANLAALTLFVLIKFFHFESAVWLDFSSLTNRPWILIATIVTTSGLVGLVLGVMGAAISTLFGKGGTKGSAGAPRRAARPQSSRRTTI